MEPPREEVRINKDLAFVTNKTKRGLNGVEVDRYETVLINLHDNIQVGHF